MDRAGSALRRARALQERLYADTCTVHAAQKLTDPQTHVTGSQWVAVIENQPCRVSFSQFPATGQNATADTVSQSVKLFISPEVAIPAGKTVRVSFPLTDETFRWWSEQAQDMVPLPGCYEVLCGGSSEDLQRLDYTF